jgi:hypothetical protein
MRGKNRMEWVGLRAEDGTGGNEMRGGKVESGERERVDGWMDE